MKCTIPEISWHNRDPVLSVDIQKSSTDGTYRLATGGTDTHVVIWQLVILENGGVAVEMLSDLTRHNRAINAVRFSPDGQILGSSDDEAAIILWKKNEEASNDIFVDENEKDNKEHWTILKMLRGHIEDVYDLCWSSCSQFLISGSVDNSAIMWDVQKGKNIGILSDHKGFVQGVAWDPKGQYVATLSSDRYLRVHNISTKKVVNKVHKSTVTASSQSEEPPQKSANLFYDDTLKSFCRRLTFSPDGNLLLTPSGILENGEGTYINVTHVFMRSSMSRPVVCLPTFDKYTIAVRFCPILFELRTHHKSGKENVGNETSPSPYTDLFNLPYRMVFAVATQNSLLIYDTQQPIPFAKISNIHYTRLTDLSWSGDGRILVVSSTDGYCSLVSFTDGELGIPYNLPKEPVTNSPKSNSTGSSPAPQKQSPLTSSEANKTPEEPLEIDAVKSKENEEKVATPIPVKRMKDRKPGKRVQLITLSTKGDEKTTKECATTPPKNVEEKLDAIPITQDDEAISDQDSTKRATESAVPSSTTPSSCGPKNHRRVSLITLSSPKGNKKNLKDDS